MMMAKNFLAFLLAALWISALLFRVYLINEYGRTLPKEPQPSIGRIIKLNNHGTVVFLTRDEDSRLTWLFTGGMACGICAGVLSFGLRKSGK